MKQGIFTFIFTIFLSSLVFLIQKPASAIEIPQYPTFNCVENAKASLDSILDIQTFLDCNGFNPGPIDGVRAD